MEQKQKLRFYLTGFGKFCKVENNPTSELIKYFEVRKEEFCINKCDVLDVNIEAVQKYFDELNPQIFDDDFLPVFIHFGVSQKSETFQLELHGYNDADFRIPDTNSNQPQNTQIDVKMPLEHYYRTQIPIIQIQKNLSLLNHKVELSTDPGRFVCNYIYYHSLNHSYKCGCPSLFVHFPEFKVISFDDQLQFVQDLLEEIKQYYEK